MNTPSFKHLIAYTAVIGGIMIAVPTTLHATPNPPPQSENNVPPPPKPGGCIKDGLIGGVGGHFVGQGHTKMGAAGGCAYGMYQRHKWKKEMRAYNAEHPQPSHHHWFWHSSQNPK